MFKKYCFLISLLCLACQNKNNDLRKKFSNAGEQVKVYLDSSNQAYYRKDIIKQSKYRDSVRLSIVNSFIDNYTFKTIKGSEFEISNLKKPLFLEVTSSSCPPCRFQIPTLNKIVEKYKDSVDFVLLFSDDKKRLKTLASSFNENINLVPLRKRRIKNGPYDFSGFLHYMGFPSKYYITTNKKIVNFTTGALMSGGYITNRDSLGELISETLITKEIAEKMNFSHIEEEIKFLLTQNK